MTRIALIALFVASTTCTTGCHMLETAYAPVAHHGKWDPVLGSCETCGTCGGSCEGHTPASYVGHVLACESGCGEVYWGPWLNDPPDACDPCDDCGNWIGPRCCEPDLRQRLVSGLLSSHHNKGKAKGKGCKNCKDGRIDGVPTDGTIEMLPPENVDEVLPPTPDPIEPAAASQQQRPRFQLRSVRFER